MAATCTRGFNSHVCDGLLHFVQQMIKQFRNQASLPIMPALSLSIEVSISNNYICSVYINVKFLVEIRWGNLINLKMGFIILSLNLSLIDIEYRFQAVGWYMKVRISIR